MDVRIETSVQSVGISRHNVIIQARPTNVKCDTYRQSGEGKELDPAVIMMMIIHFSSY
jgi:hypothetical protein